jgi:hypothetical protein
MSYINQQEGHCQRRIYTCGWFFSDPTKVRGGEEQDYYALLKCLKVHLSPRYVEHSQLLNIT